jgi:cbb3-type cytochrome oxidase subunit 3
MDSGAVHLLATLASNATSAAANGTAAAAAGHKAGGKKPKKHYYFMARNSWETIAGVIIALAIINVFTRGYAYWRRRRHANQSAATLLDKQEGLAMVDGNLKAARIPQAGASVLQNLGMCTTLPWWLGGATLGEAFWNIGYCAALGVFAFHQSEWSSSGAYLFV